MVKFRTKYNPGSYEDYEHYEPGTSLTEPGQAETMEQLMARLTREPNRPIDLSSLKDEDVDQLMQDADLDAYEDEGKPGMASALDDMAAAFVANQSEEVAESKERIVKNQATPTSAADEQVPVSHLGDSQANNE